MGEVSRLWSELGDSFNAEFKPMFAHFGSSLFPGADSDAQTRAGMWIAICLSILLCTGIITAAKKANADNRDNVPAPRLKAVFGLSGLAMLACIVAAMYVAGEM